MNARQIERLSYMAHIYEAADKSKEIDNMLTLFYKKICAVAKLNGIQLSTLRLPQYSCKDEDVDQTDKTEK